MPGTPLRLAAKPVDAGVPTLPTTGADGVHVDIHDRPPVRCQKVSGSLGALPRNLLRFAMERRIR